jgi:hypothetical protein
LKREDIPEEERDPKQERARRLRLKREKEQRRRAISEQDDR